MILVQNHYKILDNHFSPEIIKSILENNNIELSCLVGKSGNNYLLNFSRMIRFYREGEITVTLTDTSDNLDLTTITFSFGKDESGNNFMLIGGLQGVQSESAKERIVKVTRDLNGLRPKYAVLECAYALASFFGVTSITATSIANHPSKHTNQKRLNNFFADYDSFWQEIGGELDSEGNFSLPLILPKRELADVPSKKKKDWLKRQEHLGQIQSFSTKALNLLQEPINA